jgi:archaellum component FlaC
MAKKQTTLDVSIEQLRDLLDDVEADFGFDYSCMGGLKALRELRRIIGGEPNRNIGCEP